ncbi:MAG: hypothetical protein ABIU54_02040 [Candidatus Eisenbacteria bacterium]
MPTTDREPVQVPPPIPWQAGRSAALTGAEARDPVVIRRDERLGVVNGALYQGGEGFIDSNTVIPVFLSSLTTSNAAIGLATAMGDLGWLLPQFLVAPSMAREKRQLWLYRRAAIARAIGLGALALLVPFLVDHHPQWLLAAFFLGYGAYCFGGGFGSVPFMEVVGKTIPPRRLGAFWSRRLFWGGSIAAGVALLVREILRWPAAGLRFGVLFGLATVAISIGYALFLRIDEPDGTPDPEPYTSLELLAHGWRLLRHDRPFRQILLGRTLLSVWFAASPFVVLFAVDTLKGGARATGTFLFARVTGFVLSTLLWKRVSNDHGNSTVLRISAIAAGLAALIAAGVAYASPWRFHLIPSTSAVFALEGVALVGGAAQAGILVAFGSLLIGLAPQGRRQMFVSVMLTFLGVTTLLPMLGGAFVDAFGAPLLFAVCGVTTLVGASRLARLPESRGLDEGALAGCSDCMNSGGGQ